MAQEHGSPGGPGSGLKGSQSGGLANDIGKDSEMSYVSAAHIIIPGAAAALLGGHALQSLGGGLPLSPLSPQPLDLSTLGCPSSPAGNVGPLLSFNSSPLGLTKSSLISSAFPSASLGLPMVPMLGTPSERRTLGQQAKKGRGEEVKKQVTGGVLNLSTGVSHDPMSWVVIPPGTVVLKPAVVN